MATYNYSKQNAQKEELAKFTTDKMKEIAENLKKPDGKALAELHAYFKQFANFYNYSARNIVMMENQAAQRAMSLSKVQSFKEWGNIENDKGEKVRINKGERGLKLLVPVIKKLYERNKKGEYLLDNKGKRIPSLDEKGKQKTSLYFNLGTVFDLQQTNAIEIRAIKKSHIFQSAKANTLNIDEKFVKNMMEKIAEKYNLKADIQNMNNKLASGYNAKNLAGDSRIVIDETLTAPQKLSVLFHELGHHILHEAGSNIPKEQKEAEAESFSYVLSSKFGIDNNSSVYIKGYVNNEDDLMKLLTRVQKAVYNAHQELDLNTILKNKLNETEQEANTIVEDKTTVKINWSENPNFKEGEILSLKEADEKFRLEDTTFDKKNGYDKVSFEINCFINGKEDSYVGRYDIGDKFNGLINHIRANAEFYIANEKDVPITEDERKSYNYILKEFVPFLESEIAKEKEQKKAQEEFKQESKKQPIQKQLLISEDEMKILTQRTNDELHTTNTDIVLNSLGIDFRPKKNGTQLEFSIRSEDKTPSANLYIAKDGNWKFHDFGSGDSGTIENVVMKATNYNYRQARDYAISTLGITDYFAEELASRKAENYIPKEIKLDESATKKLEELKEANKEKASKYNNNTKILSINPISENNTQAMEYISKRGITKIPDFMYEATGEIFGTKNGRSYNIKNSGLGVATTSIEPLDNDILGIDIHYYKPVELKNGNTIKSATYGANGISTFINGTGKKLVIAESKWDMATANEKDMLKNSTCIIANSTGNTKEVIDFIKDKNFDNTLILNQNDKPGAKFKDNIINSDTLDTKNIYIIKYNADETKQDINDLLLKDVDIRSRITKHSNPDTAMQEIKDEMKSKAPGAKENDLESKTNVRRNR